MKLPPQLAVSGLIFFGTICSLLAKLIYSVPAPSIHGTKARYEKPWFQVLAMFVGMSACILLDLPKSSSGSQETGVWIISIPTLLDLFATACGTTGLLYTPVSVYQMLRGAMLVFTAMMSVLFLRRRLSAMNYAGIGLCLMGTFLVGVANILADTSSRKNTIFGIGVILLGQVLQAGQAVMEEFLLQDKQISSVRVVAWEGLFGVFHCVLWVFPIVYLLPGRDHGHLEDVVDAWYMLSHSWAIAGIICMDMTMMLFYNLCGMEVTDSLSAVHRVVIETLRTIAVWVVDLAIYYLISPSLGEAWTKWSWLQLAGFMLMVAGTVVYNYDKLKKDYEESVVEEEEHVEKVDTEMQQATETTPLAVGFDDDDEEEEDRVGSFYGSAVGSVAFSPYLAATPPLGLRQRSGSRFTP